MLTGASSTDYRWVSDPIISRLAGIDSSSMPLCLFDQIADGARLAGQYRRHQVQEHPVTLKKTSKQGQPNEERLSRASLADLKLSRTSLVNPQGIVSSCLRFDATDARNRCKANNQAIQFASACIQSLLSVLSAHSARVFISYKLGRQQHLVYVELGDQVAHCFVPL